MMIRLTNVDNTPNFVNSAHIQNMLEDADPDSSTNAKIYVGDRNYHIFVKERPEEIFRMMNHTPGLLEAAKYLLLGATGTEDGPTSWGETRQRWLDAVSRLAT